MSCSRVSWLRGASYRLLFPAASFTVVFCGQEQIVQIASSSLNFKFNISWNQLVDAENIFSLSIIVVFIWNNPLYKNTRFKKHSWDILSRKFSKNYYVTLPKDNNETVSIYVQTHYFIQNKKYYKHLKMHWKEDQ